MMLSVIPTKISDENKEKEMLRAGIIAELDAINLYEQMADNTEDEQFKKIVLDITKEEKTHVGEFLDLLLNEDREQDEEIKKARVEVKEKLKRVI
jgi:rubrerythrin